MSTFFHWLIFLSPVLALVFAVILLKQNMKTSPGNEKMQEIAAAIQKGAMAFLKTEYTILTIFSVLVAGAIFCFIDKYNLLYNAEAGTGATALSFVLGAFLSALAGWIGMWTATRSAVRTTEAAKEGLTPALRIAFRSGTVMGMVVVSLGLLGVAGLYYWIGDIKPIFGFSFGASAIALFARVGGGIYTKAADVGADLVGKVEAGIPEDDPRNPAVIADNVGDNVGDVAGMGADLFESYVGSIVASVALAAVLLDQGLLHTSFGKPEVALVLPMAIAGLGILASIFGSFFVSTNDENKLNAVLLRGLLIASVVLSIGVVLLVKGAAIYIEGYKTWGVWASILIGVVLGVLVGLATELYTSERKKHAQWIADQSKTGPATNIIAGLSIG